jgi:hypothetical protein
MIVIGLVYSGQCLAGGNGLRAYACLIGPLGFVFAVGLWRRTLVAIAGFFLALTLLVGGLIWETVTGEGAAILVAIVPAVLLVVYFRALGSTFWNRLTARDRP